jgi:serine phosphatase RsbU (regulator of sigma subunit)
VGRILTATNRLLASDVSDGRNVTLLLAQLDPARGGSRQQRRPSPAGVVLDRHGTERGRLYATGMPLGILADADTLLGRRSTFTPETFSSCLPTA